MYCPYKNSYLQLGTVMDPRTVNKAVRRAMRKKQFDPHDEPPPAQRLESMQPSLFAPCVDVTRARLGFGRVGLRIISRDLHSQDGLIKLQAIHSILDQIQISESAMFLISLNVVFRIIEMMTDRDPIVREKVALILTHLGNYYQARMQIMAQPVVIDRLMYMCMRDRKEVRYAAALCLKRLTKDRCACEEIMKNDKIIENLLKMIKNDHHGIIVLHIHSLTNLAEWDPVKPLKANTFQLMMKVMQYEEYRLQQAALDCLTQLCKHSVGRKLADMNDLTLLLRSFLVSEHLDVIISAVGLMAHTTLTTQSKFRVKEFAYDLTKRLVVLCVSHTVPVLQIRAMQVLTNICECPDIRNLVKKYWEKNIIRGINIKTAEQWDGTSETTTIGRDTGHGYRTVYKKNVECIKNDFGDDINTVNVHKYLSRVRLAKLKLIDAINVTPYAAEKALGM